MKRTSQDKHNRNFQEPRMKRKTHDIHIRSFQESGDEKMKRTSQDNHNISSEETVNEKSQAKSNTSFENGNEKYQIKHKFWRDW